MRRREFIAVVGGAAAWPLTARAQQPAMPVVGWLNSGTSDDPLFMSFVSAFRAGLSDAGYIEGQNVAIDFRWGEGQYSRLPTLAAELVAKRVDVILAGGPPAALAAKAATQTIPIIFTSGDDPVRLGLVASLSRPGGNATGVAEFADEIEAKRLGLLREVVQGATTTIAVLLNSKAASFDAQSKDVREAARAGGFKVIVLSAASAKEIDEAFTILVQAHAAALVIGGDPYLNSARKQLIALAAHQSILTMFNGRAAAADGGLMSYGISFADAYRQAGIYVSRVLKGEKPADLPVIRSTKFELVINLATAKQLGLTIPSGVLAIADEVIE